jgi:hypothetical protein
MCIAKFIVVPSNAVEGSNFGGLNVIIGPEKKFILFEDKIKDVVI